MDFQSPPSSPIDAARSWFDEAVASRGRPNPLAAALSTLDEARRPWSRMVLLKQFDAQGAVFFTNYKSGKALEIARCGTVSLLWHWDDLQRQLGIQGLASPTSDEESDAYFATRPRESQIGAWASDQSRPLVDRDALIARAAELAAKWEGKEIPRPPHWGGYRVSLDRVEFWCGRDGRLHDRLRYVADGDGWQVSRLQP